MIKISPRFACHQRYLVVIVLIAVLALGACSSIQQSENTSPPKILVVWSGVDFSHDPLLATTTEQYFLSSLENRTLFSLDEKGNIEDSIAVNHTVSKDGKNITVELGEVSFSNDKDITAADVKASISRLMVLGGEYSKLFENVKGAGEAKNGSDFFGITAPSNKVIDFELIDPDPFFVYRLAHPATGILPASSIGIKGEITSNIYSGLYSADVISNELNATTAFKPRNPDLPIINVVRKSAEDLANVPVTEDVDIVLGQIDKNNKYKSISIPLLAVASWNIYVKGSTSPFAKIDFRKAVLLALDEKESVDAFSTKAVSPIGFTATTFDSTDCGISCETDRKEAEKLIKGLYPEGNIPEISIHIEDSVIQQELAKSAVSKLSGIGIKANVVALDAVSLSNEIARGNVQLFRFGWVNEIAVGATPVVRSFKADSSENVSGVTDTELEKEINQYLNATSSKTKLKASEDVQKRLKELWLTRPVAHFHKIVSTKKAITGYSFDFYGRTDVSQLEIKE